MSIVRAPRRSKQRRSLDIVLRHYGGLRNAVLEPPSALFKAFANIGPGGDNGGYQPKLVREKAFLGNTTATATGWVTFDLPKNAGMAMIVCVGGGGGGGGGKTGATATNKTGGGGGGSGALGRLIIPVRFLPKTLYLLPGLGGASVGAGIAGNAATSSAVSDQATLFADTILQSGNVAAKGGGAGGTTVAGALGAAETIATFAALASNGVTTFIAGQAGTASGADTPTNGGSVTWGGSGVFCSGGCGGGSAGTANGVSNGGGIVGGGLVQSFSGGTGLAAGPGGAGVSGSNLGSLLGYSTQAFAAWGGTGGGSSSTAGVGGAGGYGGYGSGGGGGGAGVTGGGGGRGGAGYIYIAWW